MIKPVFALWFERRLSAVVDLFSRTVCQPILEALAEVPPPDDPRLNQLERACRMIAERTIAEAT